MTDVVWTYCGDQFAVYTNVKLVCCIPETNIVLYVNYTALKKIQPDIAIILP